MVYKHGDCKADGTGQGRCELAAKGCAAPSRQSPCISAYATMPLAPIWGSGLFLRRTLSGVNARNPTLSSFQPNYKDILTGLT